MVLTAAYAYFIKKMEFKSIKFGSGAAVSSVSMGIFALFNLSLFFEFILVLIIGSLIKKKLDKGISIKDLDHYKLLVNKLQVAGAEPEKEI